LLLAALLLMPLLAEAQQAQAAKDFTLKDINLSSPSFGQLVKLSDYDGAIIVLLFITPQTQEAQQKEILASLTNGLWALYGKGSCVRFFVIGGFARETQAQILAMRPSSPSATFPILYDPDKAAWGASTSDLYQSLSSSNVPLAVVIDHNFKIYNSKSTVADYQNYNPQLVTWVQALSPEDTEPPSAENFNYPNDSRDVPLCAKIEFDITDQCGVDIGTLSFTGPGMPSVTWTTSRAQGGYHVVFWPVGGCWPPEDVNSPVIGYLIGCSDYAGNKMSHSYAFGAVRPSGITASTWTNQIPAADATNVDPNIVISFDIYNDTVCIDGSSIVLKVGPSGSEQDVTSMIVKAALPGHEGFHVVYDAAAAFNIGDVIDVHLTVDTVCQGQTFDDSYEFTVGAGGPTFTNKDPADGATDVPPGQTTISVDVTDVLYGIDQGTIQMSINDESKGISASVIDNGYHVSFTHGLADSQTYTVRGKAYNLAGRPGEDKWSFTTVDNTPPVLTSRRPGSNAYNVAVDTDIFFQIYDSGVGVAPASIRLWVNSVEQSLSANFKKVQHDAGSDALYDCTFTPASSFTEGQVVTVDVEAADKRLNAMAKVSWNFTCSSVPVVAMAGWGATGIYASALGEFEAWAVVEFGEGMDMIRNVQMYTMNPGSGVHYPVGIFLDQIGYFNGSGLFYYHEYMPKGTRIGMLPVYEIAAEDIYGNFSALWPYLTIVDGSKTKSSLSFQGPEEGFDPTDVPWRIQALMDRYGVTVPDDPSGIFSASVGAAHEPPSLRSDGSSPVPLLNRKPVVFAAGFYPPRVDISQTSSVLLKALVLDPDGPEDIERVEIYVDGMPTGITLLDDGTQTDDVPGDGFYVRDFTLEANSRPEGLLLVQIIAFDYAGNVSNVYPYITVEP